jgi:Flp pilus assembly pilin Flp
MLKKIKSYRKCNEMIFFVWIMAPLQFERSRTKFPPLRFVCLSKHIPSNSEHVHSSCLSGRRLIQEFFMQKFSFKKKVLGQGMTEYIIIVALIAVAAIGVYAMFGKTVRTQMAGVTNELSGTSAKANITAAKAEAVKATTTAAKSTNLGNYDETASTAK